MAIEVAWFSIQPHDPISYQTIDKTSIFFRRLKCIYDVRTDTWVQTYIKLHESSNTRDCMYTRDTSVIRPGSNLILNTTLMFTKRFLLNDTPLLVSRRRHVF